MFRSRRLPLHRNRSSLRSSELELKSSIEVLFWTQSTSKHRQRCLRLYNFLHSSMPKCRETRYSQGVVRSDPAKIKRIRSPLSDHLLSPVLPLERTVKACWCSRHHSAILSRRAGLKTIKRRCARLSKLLPRKCQWITFNSNTSPGTLFCLDNIWVKSLQGPPPTAARAKIHCLTGLIRARALLVYATSHLRL